jgi:hypothetical protein
VGASIDADGKSNIWAVEPKIQVALSAWNITPDRQVIEGALQVQEQQGNQLLVPAAMVSWETSLCHISLI